MSVYTLALSMLAVNMIFLSHIKDASYHLGDLDIMF